MQSKSNPPLRPTSTEGRSTSAPPPLNASRPSASASDLHRQAVGGAPAPKLTRTPTDQFFSTVQNEDDEIDEAWGEMEDEPFHDAPSDQNENTAPSPAPAPPPVSFDDGGEPDFEGWLSAQAKAKSKAPLPKGLAKTTKPATTRTTTTGGVGTGAGVKKVAATTVAKPTVIDTKPKDEAADDDWGDAWD